MENTLTLVLTDHMSKTPVKPYYSKELARLYDVSVYTMRKWIRKIPDMGDRVGWRWSVNQVEKIFRHLGCPEKEENN